ncbi:ADP-dependent glucokinase-like [Haliotis cracherodii]|uniref:ADP-dependent glucokinase-like n=1 Tax=Haliotis cracherodii TaxID=6455 RepID=UPI0039ECA60B
MASTGFKAGSVITVLVVIAAYLCKRHADEALRERVHQVLSGLLRAEKKVPHPKFRVAIGFGGCQDLVSDGLELLEKMHIGAPDNPKHFHSVDNETELAQLMGFFFRHGAAAERYISNETLFKELVDKADSLSHRVWSLGGNAPVMANRLAKEGLDVLLGARLTPNMAKALDPSIKVTGKQTITEDVHLLLEYKAGAKWGQYTAPRANRLIVHSDSVNPFLESLEEFQQQLETYNADLLIVGGLQMMDNFPFKDGKRQERVKKLESTLSNIPKKTQIHFELASFTDKSLMDEIYESVVLYSDSLGMNEQELPNLVSMMTGGNVTLLSDSHPRIATTLDQMRQVYNMLKNTKETGGRRKLTRIHLHTLAYQAILTKKGSAWKNTMSAAAKAALTAHRHVCGSQYIHVEKAKLIVDDSFSSSKSDPKPQRIPIKDNRPVTCWEEEDYEICIAPVLVCTQVLQTGGGGDNVSSAGLVLQL